MALQGLRLDRLGNGGKLKTKQRGDSKTSFHAKTFSHLRRRA
jgi:hypothetical protein